MEDTYDGAAVNPRFHSQPPVRGQSSLVRFLVILAPHEHDFAAGLKPGRREVLLAGVVFHLGSHVPLSDKALDPDDSLGIGAVGLVPLRHDVGYCICKLFRVQLLFLLGLWRLRHWHPVGWINRPGMVARPPVLTSISRLVMIGRHNAFARVKRQYLIGMRRQLICCSYPISYHF